MSALVEIRTRIDFRWMCGNFIQFQWILNNSTEHNCEYNLLNLTIRLRRILLDKQEKAFQLSWTLLANLHIKILVLFY